MRLNFRLGPLSFRHYGGMTEALPRLLSRADLEGNHSYKIIYSGFRLQSKNSCMSLKTLVGPAGLEPATPCLEGRCSIHLSYGPIGDSILDSIAA